MTFEWNPEKDLYNQENHGLSFEQAQQAFFDVKHGARGHSSLHDA